MTRLYHVTAVRLSALKPVLLLRLNKEPSSFYKVTRLLPSKLSQIHFTVFHWLSGQQSESVILKASPMLCAIACQTRLANTTTFLPEKDLQVPQGPEQSEPLGCGAEGDQSAGGHGFDFATPGRVHPSGPTEHHLHTAGWGREDATCKHCWNPSVSPWEWFALVQLCCEITQTYPVRNNFVFFVPTLVPGMLFREIHLHVGLELQSPTCKWISANADVGKEASKWPTSALANNRKPTVLWLAFIHTITMILPNYSLACKLT